MDVTFCVDETETRTLSAWSRKSYRFPASGNSNLKLVVGEKGSHARSFALMVYEEGEVPQGDKLRVHNYLIGESFVIGEALRAADVTRMTEEEADEANSDVDEWAKK